LFEFSISVLAFHRGKEQKRKIQPENTSFVFELCLFKFNIVASSSQFSSQLLLQSQFDCWMFDPVAYFGKFSQPFNYRLEESLSLLCLAHCGCASSNKVRHFFRHFRSLLFWIHFPHFRQVE